MTTDKDAAGEEVSGAEDARVAAAPGGPGAPEGAPGATDTRDTLEIDVQLTDDTFEVSRKAGDEVDIKIRFNPRLKIGVGILAFSFVMSGVVFILTPWAIATGNDRMQLWCGYLYFSSWIVMGVGVLIGGQSAKHIVTGWRVRFKHALKTRIIDRRSPR